MSEDTAEEKDGLQALNTTSRQLRYYYCRKILERMPQHRTHRAEALQSIILSATPTSRKVYMKCGIMVKIRAQTKHSLMPEFKGMVMDRDVGRKISANHALRIKRKSQKTAKTLAVSKGKVYRDSSMIARTIKFRKGRVSPLWMNRIHNFFFREDISRAVPGKTVSAAFKQHKAKYLLSITVEDAYKILQDENPAFPYKFTIFKKFHPPNVRNPTYSVRLSQTHKC